MDVLATYVESSPKFGLMERGIWLGAVIIYWGEGGIIFKKNVQKL